MAKQRKLHPEYWRGYKDGVKSRDKRIVQNDLKYIYAAMGVIMHRRGYKDETIEKFINDIGALWVDSHDNEYSIPELLKELTGIDIVQMTSGE